MGWRERATTIGVRAATDSGILLGWYYFGHNALRIDGILYSD